MDWRFLLPDPYPRRTVCFCHAELAESLRLISGLVVEGSAADQTSGFDLAVLDEASAPALTSAREFLRPGGHLYWEWRGGSPRAAGIRRWLAVAGFEEVRLFWPDRDPEAARPAAWLPLPWDGAARHFLLENRGRSRTPWRRAGRMVARSASFAATRMRGPRTLCALARKPGSPAAPSRPARDLTALVLDRWEDWELGRRPARLSWLLLTGGMRSDSKVIALLFADGQVRPGVALKMPRTPEGGAAIDREAAVLRRVRELAPAACAGIPRLLFHESDGSPILGETAFTGVPLLSAWNEDTIEKLVQKAATWLGDLAEGRPSSPRELWHARLVDEPLGRFAASFGKALDGALLREAERLLGALPVLPLVFEQRDFSPWNVLLTPDDELAVVDWESAEPEGLPALDLVYFLVNTAFALDRARRTGRYRESYRGLLDASTRHGGLAARCVGPYFRRLGLPASALQPLRLLTWVVHSGAEFERLRSDHGGSPPVEVLREAVCLQLFEEELRAREASESWL